MVAALALSAHSVFDGVGIGLGFQVSTTVGLAVAVAVIAHDFSDGLNTVALMLLNGNTSSRTWRLLLLDAATPLPAPHPPCCSTFPTQTCCFIWVSSPDSCSTSARPTFCPGHTPTTRPG